MHTEHCRKLEFFVTTRERYGTMIVSSYTRCTNDIPRREEEFFFRDLYPLRPLKNAKPSGKKWIKGILGKRPYILEFQNVELPQIFSRKRVYSGNAHRTLPKKCIFFIWISFWSSVSSSYQISFYDLVYKRCLFFILEIFEGFSKLRSSSVFSSSA